MTYKADFYVMDKPVQAIELLACNLIEKVYTPQSSIYIQVWDDKAAEKFDALLWTYKNTSFLPHECWQPTVEISAPILIGNYQSAPACDILINLTWDLFPFVLQFKHIIEFVPTEETWKARARKKYQYFQQQKWEVNCLTVSV